MSDTLTKTPVQKRSFDPGWTTMNLRALSVLWHACYHRDDIGAYMNRGGNSIAVKASKEGLGKRPNTETRRIQRNPDGSLPDDVISDMNRLVESIVHLTEMPHRPRPVNTKGKEKKCLWCGSMFWSTHAGHWKCDSCRSSGSDDDMVVSRIWWKFEGGVISG